MAPAQCNIHWNSLTPQQWQDHLGKTRRAPLLQDARYGVAMARQNRQQTRCGLIMIDGVEAGLVQILEAQAFGRLLHAPILDRGPVWFEGFGADDHWRAFLERLQKDMPRRPGRRRRIMPELEDSDRTRTWMSDLGFKPIKDITGYRTFWLALDKEYDALRNGLKQKWRNILNKAERSDIATSWHYDPQNLRPVLEGYHRDKQEKGYTGPSQRTLLELAKHFMPGRDMLIGHAFSGEDMIASVLIFIHGASATYQVGWTTRQGRHSGAHHLLLWQACSRLQSRAILDFDLGGFNDDQANGLYKFKAGMGGKETLLVGAYH
jgi:hypothetical protein